MIAPWDIELDRGVGLLYWTTRSGVWRSNLDGSSAAELIAGPFVDDEQHAAIALELPLMVDGASCASADVCVSGHCVDGFCCESACDGRCRSCDGSHTGMADGECHPATFAPNVEPMCDDFDPCTDDLCTATATCDHVVHERAWDDGDPPARSARCARRARASRARSIATRARPTPEPRTQAPRPTPGGATAARATRARR